jgi:hypothetical protein
MSARLRLVAAVAVVAAVLQVAGPTGAQTSDPSVHLDRTGTAKGEGMLVTGDGWPAGATLIVELCGHGGLRGTVDCDVGQQRTAGAGASGHFSVELTTGTPPTPCPCVIKATDQATRIAATAPIAVAGIPTVPITEEDLPKARSIEISSMEISGGGRWAELFGAGGRRVLEITLVNTGPLAVEAPDVTVVWGTGTSPKGFVEPPETTRMEPGDTQVLTVALDRPALTIGKQTAVVEVQGLAEPVTRRATTTAYPWGLLAVALVLLQLVLLWVRNRIRRRLHGAPAPAVDEPSPEPALAALAAAPLALPAAPPGDDGATSDEPTVLDLDEPAHSGPIALAVAANGSNGTHGSNASGSNGTSATTSGAGDAMEARLELMALQLQARQVINRSVALSDAVVAASTARAQELDARSAQRLQGAVARHTEAVEVLEAAKARADEIIASATAAAAAALRDAGSHEAGAHQALVEMQAQHERLAASAATAVDQVMRDLDAQMAALGAEAEADASGDGGDGAPTPRAPRLGSIDDRLARAVSLAFADSARDVTTTD